MPELEIAPRAEASVSPTAPSEPPSVPSKPTVLIADMSSGATAVDDSGTQALMSKQIRTFSPMSTASTEDSVQYVPPMPGSDSLTAAAPKAVQSTPKSATSDRTAASVDPTGLARESSHLASASTDSPGRKVTLSKEEASSKQSAETESGSDKRVYSESFAYMEIDGGG